MGVWQSRPSRGLEGSVQPTESTFLSLGTPRIGASRLGGPLGSSPNSSFALSPIRWAPVELDRRAEQFRRGRTRVPLTGRVVVVVDDGVATGSTARAACQVAREEGAARVALAVPVAPKDWTNRLGDEADELIAVDTPEFFMAVGQHYRDFDQTTDDEVIRCLDRAARHVEHLRNGDDPLLPFDDDIAIDLDDVSIGSHLTVPDRAHGVVLFAHGSGSSRHSPRNRYVARVLNKAGLATLLFDLLTEHEELDRANVFDIELLATRLLDVTANASSPSDSSRPSRTTKADAGSTAARSPQWPGSAAFAPG